jgi:hypothetical protein
MRLWVHHAILVVTTKVTPKHTHLIGVALHFEIPVHPKRRVPTVADQPIINVGRGVGTGTNNGHGVVHVVARAIRNDAGRITTQTRRINPNLANERHETAINNLKILDEQEATTVTTTSTTTTTTTTSSRSCQWHAML